VTFVEQHGHDEESRMVAAQVIKSMNQQDDDDSYEAKSVRDLKAMFNKPSKPPVPGQSKAYSVTHLSSSPFAPFMLLTAYSVIATSVGIR